MLISWQVVDERMWGEEDKPQDADAKYEKDAPVQASRHLVSCECICASMRHWSSHFYACRCQPA